jgi:hypothetical protein
MLVCRGKAWFIHISRSADPVNFFHPAAGLYLRHVFSKIQK